MYCSSCGNEIKKGLNYCSSCGARVVDIEKEKSGARTENVSTAIGFIGIGGIIGFIVLVNMFLDKNVDPPVMVLVLLAFLATIFGISFLLIKQLSSDTKKSNVDIGQQSESQNVLKSVETNQLHEARQKPASVVENTTKTLDEVLIERE